MPSPPAPPIVAALLAQHRPEHLTTELLDLIHRQASRLSAALEQDAGEFFHEAVAYAEAMLSHTPAHALTPELAALVVERAIHAAQLFANPAGTALARAPSAAATFDPTDPARDWRADQAAEYAANPGPSPSVQGWAPQPGGGSSPPGPLPGTTEVTILGPNPSALSSATDVQGTPPDPAPAAQPAARRRGA